MARFPGSILLDNNAIGDAVDLKVWKGLLGAYLGQLETVTTVAEEAGSYFRKLPEMTELLTSLKRMTVHDVTREQRAALAVRLTGVALDQGERDLWAHGIARQDAWMLCGPDIASVRAAVLLGQKDRLVSLEELLEAAGFSTRGLPLNQTRKWLDQTRSRIVFEGPMP